MGGGGSSGTSLGAASNSEKAASTATYPKHPLQSSQNWGALKVFPNSKENCQLLDIGVMLKTFANAVVDDYIMKSNGLPQL